MLYLACSYGLLIVAFGGVLLALFFHFYVRRYVKDIFEIGLPFFEFVTLF